MDIADDMIAKIEVGGEIYAVSPPPQSEEECVVAQPCFACMCFCVCVCGCGVAQSLARCILTLSTRTKDHLAHRGMNTFGVHSRPWQGSFQLARAEYRMALDLAISCARPRQLKEPVGLHT
jgi:hypothetical protein